jgi:hypothetical protein
VLALALGTVVAGCATGPAPAREPFPDGLSTAPAAHWRSSFPTADSLRVQTIAPGVEHAFVWQAAGPWAIHVVSIDRGACTPGIRAVHAGPPLTAAASTSSLAGAALAAINADFFALPGGTPVGAQVTAGEVVIGPGRRPVIGVTAAGSAWMGVGALAGDVRHRSDVAGIGQVNRPRAGDAGHPKTTALTLFTHWWGRPVTADSAAISLGVRIIAGSAARGTGVVMAATRTAGVAIGRDRIAFQGDTASDGAGAWLARRSVGDTIEWELSLVPAGATRGAQSANDAVGGFPLLLRNGAVVTDAGERIVDSFGPVRHPRTAVGWTANGARMLWVVVDGRQPPWSDGMTLAELTTLFQQLGATDAINLDGGGSTTMVVEGRVVNRVSDRNGERAVGNALVLQSCGAADRTSAGARK